MVFTFYHLTIIKKKKKKSCQTLRGEKNSNPLTPSPTLENHSKQNPKFSVFFFIIFYKELSSNHPWMTIDRLVGARHDWISSKFSNLSFWHCLVNAISHLRTCRKKVDKFECLQCCTWINCDLVWPMLFFLCFHYFRVEFHNFRIFTLVRDLWLWKLEEIAL